MALPFSFGSASHADRLRWPKLQSVIDFIFGTFNIGSDVTINGADGSIALEQAGGIVINSGASITLLPDDGDVAAGAASVATNATKGFLYVSTCAGTPTGTPDGHAGYAPIIINTTNNKLYFYSGGAWRDAGP